MTIPEHLQAVPSSGSAEVTINENNETIQFTSVYGKRQPATSGLTWAYWGGRWSGFARSTGQFTLTANATNYIVVQKSDGVESCSSASTNWDNTTLYARVYKITTNTTSVTAVEDHRAGNNGIFGGGASLTDPLLFKGVIDCSANPNYPAADAGDVYKVSVAGRIGGGSGPMVEVGDTLLCIVDSSASGTHGSVGTNWTIFQANIQEFPVDLTVRLYGSPGASAIVLSQLYVRTVNYAVNFAPSAAKALIAATAQTDFDIRKNGLSVGTMRFAASATTASFIAGSPTSFASSDMLEIVAPATPDATLADITMNISGLR